MRRELKEYRRRMGKLDSENAKLSGRVVGFKLVKLKHSELQSLMGEKGCSGS